MSHYFSQMYNTGRMWRDRKDALTKADGDIAKALRNEFVVDHCRAVWLPLPDTADIARLEAEVLSLAPDHAIAWNRRWMQAYDEPVDLVEATLRRLGWGARELAAIERQRLRFLAEALQLYVNTLERAGLSQQEMTFYLEAMASDATRLLPLLRNGGAEMERLGSQAQDLGAVLDAGAIQALQRTQIALVGVGQATGTGRIASFPRSAASSVRICCGSRRITSTPAMPRIC